MDISQEQYDQIAKKEDVLSIIEDLKEMRLMAKEMIEKLQRINNLLKDFPLSFREIKK